MRNVKNILSILIGLLVLWRLGDRIYYGFQERNESISFHPETLFPRFLNNQPEIEIIPGGIILKADRNGHFRGTALINSVAMPFVIDTGATQTVIPIKMANLAKLPIGKIGQADTANGVALLLSTRLNTLRLGNAEIRNVNAAINYSIDEVLIGMNTLKLFSMSVKNNTMTLVTSENVKASNVTTDENNMEVKKWKKEMICNGHGDDCKTTYSN